jgi:hypothetical protein
MFRVANYELDAANVLMMVMARIKQWPQCNIIPPGWFIRFTHSILLEQTGLLP